MIKKLKEKLSSKLDRLDIHTLEVVKKSSASLVVKVVGMIATFAVSIILGRTIGPEGLGIINLANRVVTFILILAIFGMNNVVLKEVAIAFERKDWQHVANTMFSSIWFNIPMAVGVCVTFILLTPWLSNTVFNESELQVPLIISLGVIVPRILSRIYASGVNGFRKIWQSSLVNETLSVAVVALGLIVLLLLGIEITVVKAAILYAIGRIVVTGSIGLYWHHLFRFKGKRVMQTRSMLKVAFPLLIVSSSALVASNADIVMLGWLSNSREVGLYSVASRLGLMTNIFLVISVSTLTPKIASLYADNKKKELQEMIQQTTKGLIYIGLATTLIYIIAGKYILGLWGQEFVSSYWILIIITIGQIFNISTGSTGMVLMMTGHEKLIGRITFISAIINLLLNYILIPKYFATGAAIATAATVIVQNIIKVIVVKRHTGILTIPFVINRI